MINIIFAIMLILSLLYEYRKREELHKKNIENLKNNIVLQPATQRKDLFGIILIGFTGFFFMGFLVFLAFFFPIRVPRVLLLSPLGIGVTIIMLVRRDIALYKKSHSFNE